LFDGEAYAKGKVRQQIIFISSAGETFMFFTGHAYRGYDNELQKLYQTLVDMSAHVGQITGLLKASLESPQDLKAEAKATDKKINEFERDVLVQVQRMLALYQPSLEEVRFITGMIKYATSLERMGDLAKSAVKRASNLNVALPASYAPRIAEMVLMAEQMMEESLRNLRDYDHDAVKGVVRKDKDVDSLYSEIVADAQREMMMNPDAIPVLLKTVQLAKDIERVADHASTLSKIDRYVHTGEAGGKKKPAVEGAA
jgi:phosphate transport system protein